ncbi:MAG: site-specific DNA-methyltransferase, partial [Deltaproteobacteria bacterium]|nr:site-specific DNA-methyltransferase [Deltaproteobacteria bacterium]
MAGKKKKSSRKKPIEQYDHKGKKRVNNPPVGLVTPDTDKETGKRQYAYDPHIDPSLQWAGKAEHTSFKIPNVSLHVHERIDPRSIIEAVRKRNGQKLDQLSLFASSEENPPLREAIEFYKHKHNWSNRLVAGDSLLVMNSLLEKEGMSGKVQMIYIDPPYGIKYGSNFQPFVNKRDVKDGKDEDLTAEPEMIKAFRDTWELGIHSYLTYLRDRLLLARELLTESGSIFVQISDENVHRVRCLMDDVFGVGNFVSIISVRKTGAVSSPDARLNSLATLGDYIIWYAKDTKKIKYRQLYVSKFETEKSFGQYNLIRGKDGEVKRLTIDELKSFSNTELQDVFQSTSLESNGYAEQFHFPVEYGGKNYKPAPTRHWSTTKEGINRLISSSRIISTENKLRYIRYLGDFPVTPLGNIWTDLMGASNLIYVVQTNEKVISRCLLMTTDPGDLVFDPTCGSGTTAYVAEQWGRRWITCDTSRVALALAKQRLMTALYDYYELAHPEEGVGSGFKYKTVPHITLKSIANNEPPAQETLFDQPFVDKSRARVSGPFTVEAVPAPVVRPLDDISAYSDTTLPADESVARSGETLRHAEWRDELLKTGIRGKKGQFILFSRVEPLPGTRWLHAEAETRPNDLGADSVREPQGIYGQPVRAVISFGSEHAPLEQRQVELAIEEAQKLVPKPKIIVFAAFQFDPEAAKDIDETDWPGVTLLKAQMDDDLLTEDLKKKRRSNQSFWLMGQPDVRLEEIQKGKDKGKYRVEVLGFDYWNTGFDYWNTKTGVIESGGTDKISIWMLDTDYDGRSLFPKQVFFPMSGQKDGWSRLAKNLKAEIDEELIEAYRGTVSLPFETGDNRR